MRLCLTVAKPFQSKDICTKAFSNRNGIHSCIRLLLFLAGSSTRNTCRDFLFAFGKMLCFLLIEKELFGRIIHVH